MVKLYLVGINYLNGGEVGEDGEDSSWGESDYIVFNNDDEARVYIMAAAVKMMLTSVPEENFEKLTTYIQKIFSKDPEHITNDDIDPLDESKLKPIYTALKKLQDQKTGVQGYFFEEVAYFTDKDDNEYEITLKPAKK